MNYEDLRIKIHCLWRHYFFK